MKNLYNYLLPVVLSLLAVSCGEDHEEVVQLTHQDPVASVSSLSPSKGYAGDELTIIGDEFGIVKEMVKVFIGSQEAEVLSCQENEIVTKVPTTASSGKVSVEIFGQRVATDLIYTVIGKPDVTAVTPLKGYVGSEVKISGNNFVSSLSLLHSYTN